MTETFGWKVIGQPSGPTTFRVKKAQFGDGYSQEAADGINNEVQSWTVQVVGTKDEINQVRAFFRRHAGARAFLWTTPLDDVGLYKVATYTPALAGGDMWTISATFEQKFAP